MTPLDELRRLFIEPTEDELMTLPEDPEWCDCHGYGTCDLNLNRKEATMPTVAQAKRTQKTKTKAPAQVRKTLNGREWECPDCGHWSNGLVLRCHICPTLVRLPEGPDRPLPGIEINEIGVVTAGHMELELKCPKSWKLSIAWQLAEVQPQRWLFGFQYQATERGTSAACSVHDTTCWLYHNDARVGAISHAIAWVKQLREFKHVDKAVAMLEELLGDAPVPDERDEYAAAECNRDGTAWTLDEWIESVSRELYRRKEVILDRTAFRDQLQDWYHAGDSVNEACDKFSARMSDAFENWPTTEPPLLNTPAVTEATVLDVPLQALVEHPDNPRQSLTGIEELAASMQANGQLVEALGRRLQDGSIQLLAGHRRYAAAKHAVIRTLRVRVLPDLDDAQALEILGRDNEERENFNPIERARWYQTMVEASGLSQRQLAERLGTSQGNLSNHIRMLTLPDVWQQRVISGEITPTMARDLVVWANRPTVLEELEVAFRDGPQDHETWTAEEFGWTLFHVVAELARRCEPTKPNEWSPDPCYLTEKQIEKHREELDLVDVTRPGGATQRRAFNVALFDQLNTAAKAKRQSGATPAKQDGDEVSEEQLALRQEKQAQQLDRKYHLYRLNWLRNRCIAELRAGSCDEWTLVTLAVWSGERGALQAAAGVRVRVQDSTLAAVAKAPSLLRQPLTEMAVAWLERCHWEGFQQALSEIDLEGLATHLNIDWQRDWACDEAFLGLHNKAQLAALLKEWKVKSIDAANGKRGDVIQEILLLDETLPMPKALKKA